MEAGEEEDWDWKAYYWRVWRALLLEFRGWSEEETAQWAKSKGYLQGDEGIDAWIGHDPVARCAAFEILPESSREKAKHIRGSQLVDLESDLMDALWPGGYQWKRVEPADADWPRIRESVAQVIGKFDLS